MVKAAEGCSLHLQESFDTLMDTLDANKTVPAFPVVSRPVAPGELGDFKGIISRARWGWFREDHTLCRTAHMLQTGLATLAQASCGMNEPSCIMHVRCRSLCACWLYMRLTDPQQYTSSCRS